MIVMYFYSNDLTSPGGIVHIPMTPQTQVQKV